MDYLTRVNQFVRKQHRSNETTSFEKKKESIAKLYK